MKALFSLLLLCAVQVQASPLPSTVGAHLVSYHSERGGSADPGDRGWNNKNPGIYARWDNGLTVGTFKNSLFKQSSYLGYTVSDKTDTFSVTLGAISGYDKVVNSGGRQEIRCDVMCRPVRVKEVVLPMVVPSIRLPVSDNLSARVSLLAVPKQPTAVHLSLEWKL